MVLLLGSSVHYANKKMTVSVGRAVSNGDFHYCGALITRLQCKCSDHYRGFHCYRTSFTPASLYRRYVIAIELQQKVGVLPFELWLHNFRYFHPTVQLAGGAHCAGVVPVLLVNHGGHGVGPRITE